MRRLAIPLLLCLPLAACESGRFNLADTSFTSPIGSESRYNFTLFGYNTTPNYDECIRTVYVPTFENKTFRRGLEFDLTRAVIRTIEQKTPFKIVDDPSKADTELKGTIVAFNKGILSRNQLNEQRESETTLTVAVIWKDLRNGEILSQPKPKGPAFPAFGPLPDLAPGAGGVPSQGIATQDTVIMPAGPGIPVEKPVLVTSTGNFIPEIGQSITTAQQTNVNRLATQIVSLMEKPW